MDSSHEFLVEYCDDVLLSITPSPSTSWMQICKSRAASQNGMIFLTLPGGSLADQVLTPDFGPVSLHPSYNEVAGSMDRRCAEREDRAPSGRKRD